MSSSQQKPLIIDLTQGTVSISNPKLTDVIEPPQIIGKRTGHTVLMWDIDAVSCHLEQSWLHMIYTDQELYYRSPCPPQIKGTRQKHRYLIAQFPDELVDFNWQWGCVTIPKHSSIPDSYKQPVVIEIQQVKNREKCGQLIHR